MRVGRVGMGWAGCSNVWWGEYGGWRLNIGKSGYGRNGVG